MKFKKIKDVDSVYICGNEIIITGSPVDDDEAHNCDFMGCGSFEHILFRGVCRWMEKGYTEELQEEGSKSNDSV